MSISFGFMTDYSANPTPTSLFNVTGSGPSTNYMIKVLGTADDITNTATQCIDASYCMAWEGTDFTSITLINGIQPSTFSWDMFSGAAFFNFTPVVSASGGSFGLSGILVISNSNSPASVNTP